MTTPTRTTEHKTTDGGFNEVEFEAKHSVTLAQSAKSEWRVAEIKIYGTDPEAIAIQAAQIARRATDALRAEGLVE